MDELPRQQCPLVSYTSFSLVKIMQSIWYTVKGKQVDARGISNKIWEVVELKKK